MSDLRGTLRRLVGDVDVKIQRDKKNLLTGGTSCSRETAELVEGGAAAREMLIKEKMEAAERMAAEGDIELSQKVMEEAEKLAKQKHHMQKVKEAADTWIDEICDICGRQISWRAPEEIEARKHGRAHPHVMGTFHTGWKRAREALVEVEKSVADLRGESKGDADGRNRSHERPRDGDQEKQRDRDRDRDGDATKRERDRERRDRDRDRAGEASREERARDRPRDGRSDHRNASPERGRERRDDRRKSDRAKSRSRSGRRDRRGSR